jgi:aspartate/methionine/tyrosine aminotransferase
LGGKSFHTPEKIKQSAKDALDQNQTFYEDDRGYAGLRQAIAEKMKRYNRLDVDPNRARF